MKVLQIAKYYPPAPGGIESYVQDISKAFIREGHSNLVLAHQFDKKEPLDLTNEAGRIVRVPCYGEILYAPVAPAYPLQLKRLLAEFKPDVVLLHMPNVSAFWPLFVNTRCKLAILWHADVVFPKDRIIHNLTYKAYSLLEKAVFKKANSVIATSLPYLAHSPTLQRFREKCFTIPLGIDFLRIPTISSEQVEHTLDKLVGRTEIRYVYAAGRFAHYKGFEVLVDAFHEIRNQLPGLHLIIAGDGEERPSILRRIRSKGLDDAVHCPGRVSDRDYWALMKGCEMFCLPSTTRAEAFGIVLLEAMVMGKPCISTDIKGSATGWVNQHGQTGLVVNPGSLHELGSAVVKLAKASDMRKRFGKAGEKRVRERFDITLNANAMIKKLATPS